MCPSVNVLVSLRDLNFTLKVVWLYVWLQVDNLWNVLLDSSDFVQGSDHTRLGRGWPGQKDQQCERVVLWGHMGSFETEAEINHGASGTLVTAEQWSWFLSWAASDGKVGILWYSYLGSNTSWLHKERTVEALHLCAPDSRLYTVCFFPWLIFNL